LAGLGASKALTTTEIMGELRDERRHRLAEAVAALPDDRDCSCEVVDGHPVTC
jgi:hypothetical protein